MKSFDADTVLSRYRSATGVPTDRREPLWDAISRRAAAGDLPAADVAPRGVSGWWSVIGTVIAVGTVVGAIAIGRTSPMGRADEHSPQPMGAALDTVSVLPATVEAPPAVPPPATTTTAAVPLAPPPAPSPELTARRARVHAQPGKKPAEVDDLAEEARLLSLARRALSSGRVSAAAKWLDEHARRYPHGRLVEARAVGRIMVTCARRGPAAAEQAKQQFRARYPGSPQLSRVDEICAERRE